MVSVVKRYGHFFEEREEDYGVYHVEDYETGEVILHQPWQWDGFKEYEIVNAINNWLDDQN